MMRYQIFMILLFLTNTCIGQFKDSDLIANSNKCRDKWQFKTLQEKLEGKVLYHSVAPWPCGNMATAGIVIIKTAANKIYRIIEMCNTDSLYKVSENIVVTSTSKPTFSFSITFEPTHKECSIIDAYFGFINRK